MTTGPKFHNTIYLHGPHHPAVRWIEAEGGDFAAVDTSGASVLIHTAAEADALVQAFTQARALLSGGES